MRAKFLPILLSFSFSLGLAGGASATPAAGWKVGFSLPLTGPGAEYGTACLQGSRMAGTMAETASSDIQWVYEDDQYTATQSLSVFRKFLSDKVDIFVIFGEPAAQALSPLIEKRKLPVLALINNSRAALRAKHIIQTLNPSEDQVHLLAKLLSKENGGEFPETVLLATEDLWIEGFVRAFNERPDLKDKVTALAISPSEMNFGSFAARAASGDFGAVGIYLFPGQAAAFSKELAVRRPKAVLFGADVLDSRSEIEMAAGGLEGAYYSTVRIPETFRKDYLAQHPDTQMQYAYNCYEVTRLVMDTHRQWTKADRADVLAELLKTASSGGRPYSVGQSNGTPALKFPMVIKQIRNGRPVEIEGPDHDGEVSSTQSSVTLRATNGNSK